MNTRTRIHELNPSSDAAAVELSWNTSSRRNSYGCSLHSLTCGQTASDRCIKRSSGTFSDFVQCRGTLFAGCYWSTWGFIQMSDAFPQPDKLQSLLYCILLLLRHAASKRTSEEPGSRTLQYPQPLGVLGLSKVRPPAAKVRLLRIVGHDQRLPCVRVIDKSHVKLFQSIDYIMYIYIYVCIHTSSSLSLAICMSF